MFKFDNNKRIVDIEDEKEYIKYINSHSMRREPVEMIRDFEKIKNAEIPPYWKDALLCSDRSETKKILFNQWKKYCKEELKNTLAYLEQNLKDIDLKYLMGEYSLIYIINCCEKGKIGYYEGKNPMQTKEYMSTEVESFWTGLNQALTGFYENVHNGFYNYSFGGMGLDQISGVDSLANYDWGFIDEIDYDITNLFTFLTNGGGMYIALDTKGDMSSGTYLWNKWDAPKDKEKGLDFWKLMDEWIVMGFDE